MPPPPTAVLSAKKAHTQLEKAKKKNVDPSKKIVELTSEREAVAAELSGCMSVYEQYSIAYYSS